MLTVTMSAGLWNISFIFSKVKHSVACSISISMEWLSCFFAELRLEIEQEEVAAYLADFEAAVAEDVVMLGSISLEEVQEEEKRLRDEHVAYLQQEAVAKRQRLQELLQREEEVKLRVAQFVKDKRKEIANREVSIFLVPQNVELSPHYFVIIKTAMSSHKRFMNFFLHTGTA